MPTVVGPVNELMKHVRVRDAAWMDFYVAPLTGGPVSAAQEACSVRTRFSDEVSVSNQGPVTTPAEIRGPLVACGRAVEVVKIHPGSLVEVWAKHNGVEAPISGLMRVQTAEKTVDVTPFLRPEDEVWVKQFGCSATSTASVRLRVGPAQAPGPPTVERQVFAGTPTVKVNGVVPGALVEVYRVDPDFQTFPIGAKIAAESTVEVGLTAQLRRRDAVNARQTICDEQSRHGPAAPVVAPPPALPTSLSPANGATNVGARPTFTWKDPSASTEAKAERFEVQLLAGSTVLVGPTSVTSASWTPPTDLPAAGKVSFQVRAVNESGRSQFAQAVVMRSSAPKPAAPTLESYDPGTRVLKGSGFLPNHRVHVRLSMFGNSVLNSLGAAVPDPREGFKQAQSDASGRISVTVAPREILAELFLDELVGSMWGVASGELMHWSANDERPNPADVTGTLWSNTLTVQVP